MARFAPQPVVVPAFVGLSIHNARGLANSADVVLTSGRPPADALPRAQRGGHRSRRARRPRQPCGPIVICRSRAPTRAYSTVSVKGTGGYRRSPQPAWQCLPAGVSGQVCGLEGRAIGATW